MLDYGYLFEELTHRFKDNKTIVEKIKAVAYTKLHFDRYYKELTEEEKNLEVIQLLKCKVEKLNIRDIENFKTLINVCRMFTLNF